MGVSRMLVGKYCSIIASQVNQLKSAHMRHAEVDLSGQRRMSPMEVTIGPDVAGILAVGCNTLGEPTAERRRRGGTKHEVRMMVHPREPVIEA